MVYDYKCDKCFEVQEINVYTWDIQIPGELGPTIDRKALDKRVHAPRKCKCGGDMKKQLANVGSPLVFTETNGARRPRFR